ncbi:hypothetical protein F5B19DRAFT_230960 [Rostrohypoxylon terebratum]|nr:hypothetical protein F5B19DRAFT_230960 [Rostrohypoxylon terebratum]
MASWLSPSPSPSPPTPEPEPLFTKFPDLPPEIRHQIWRAALPVPGINFFNVHSFPNDHNGANRSTSPPWLYLDLRRLSIKDSDAKVSRYDPSAWQARETLRRVCREARDICTLPESEAATLTLTRPKKGLFVRAGDGQIAALTSYTHREAMAREPEPQERRKVTVRADDVLCLSVENCSFNMLFEEIMSTDEVENSADGVDMNVGWVYDPQITPSLPSAIPRSRICFSIIRRDKAALAACSEPLRSIYMFGDGSYEGPLSDSLSLLMLDAYTQEVGDRRIDELTPRDEVLWDRFGDRYIALPWHSDDLPAEYRLVKVCPESNDIRLRYLRSALLRSPKRPVGYINRENSG